MENYAESIPKCPVHEGEFLERKSVGVFHPSMPDGEIVPLDYCLKSNKYFDGEKLVPLKEAALKGILFGDTSKLKLEDITVEEDMSKIKGIPTA